MSTPSDDSHTPSIPLRGSLAGCSRRSVRRRWLRHERPSAVPRSSVSERGCPLDAVNYNSPVPLHRGNLFLIGLMGAGKSTLGRQLAKRMKKRFVDVDTELESRTGVSIPTIFEIEGEKAFRDREEALIAELTRLTDIVLATGGGAVTRPASREHLKSNGTVIYLHAEPDVLFQRIGQSRHRPMLRAADPRARLAELYEQRDPLYREVADYVVRSSREEVMRFVRALDAPYEAMKREG